MPGLRLQLDQKGPAPQPWLLTCFLCTQELILAVRSSTICDSYVCNILLPACRPHQLEKVMIVVPGLNSLPGILNLTATTLERILSACPNLKKIGNLLSWKLQRSILVDFIVFNTECLIKKKKLISATYLFKINTERNAVSHHGSQRIFFFMFNVSACTVPRDGTVRYCTRYIHSVPIS